MRPSKAAPTAPPGSCSPRSALPSAVCSRSVSRRRARQSAPRSRPSGRPLALTISIGVAVNDGSSKGGTPNALLRDAEAAMFRAKRLGRGRVELVDRDLQRQAVTRLDAELALRRAIDEQELLVHYQPI